MIEFILGGSKSGKSSFGEREAVILSEYNKLYYFHTLIVNDKDDEKIVKRHLRQRRGFNFTSVDASLGIKDKNKRINKEGTILLDSLATMVSNFVFDASNNYMIDKDAYNKIISEIDYIISLSKNVVIVSDYIFSNIEELSNEMKEYLNCLGMVHRYVASISDRVYEVQVTLPKRIK